MVIDFMLTGLCNQEIQWLGLRTRVPEEWQVVRHGLLAARGQIVLVDRYRQRMQLTWVQCAGEPDLGRMLADDRARQLDQHPGAILQPLVGVDGWCGAVRSFDDGSHVVTRAIHFDAATGRLLEASILASAAADDAELVGEVLGETAVVSRADEVTRWSAFDLDVHTPSPRWRLTATHVVPADVTFTFTHLDADREDRPSGAIATVRRIGMADTWWTGESSAASTLRKLGGTAREARDGEYLGRPARLASGHEPGPRLKRLLGWLRERRDVVFHCASCNAVYLISVLSPPRQPVGPDAFVVRCGGPRGACADA